MTDAPDGNGKAMGYIAADEVRRYFATQTALAKTEGALTTKIANIEGQFSMARWLVVAVAVPSITTIVMATMMLLRIWTAP